MAAKPIITGDDLLDLAEQLRRLGFILDTGQYLNAHKVQDLLFTLEVEQGRQTPERLCTLLAPIFCGTPDEQDTFYFYFDEWLTNRLASKKKPATGEFVPEQSPIAEQKTTKRKQWRFSIFTAAMALLLAGFLYFMLKSQVQTIKPTVDVFGKVFDALDSTAVAGASVNFLHRTTATGTEGLFHFAALPKDSISRFKIQHPGYLEHTGIPINTSAISDTLDFVLWEKLPGPLELTGVVIETNSGKPIPNAIVTFLKNDQISDANGRFRFRYLPRDSVVRVTSRHLDYLPSSAPVALHGHFNMDVKIRERERPSDDVEQLRALVNKINKFADSQKQPEPRSGLVLFFDRHFEQIHTGFPGLWFVLFLGWLWRRWRQGRVLLEKRATAETPDERSFIVRGIANYLFRNALFRRTVQQLRQHREVESPELDPAATVNLTVNNGGLFTPVFASRYILPEYLVLIDRAAFNDQHARYIDELVKRMSGDGVVIDFYYFNRDPRFCRPEKAEAAQVPIQSLFARHPKHRLLIFSDAERFINPRTGRPQAWLDDFTNWSNRAVFIPDKTEGAEQREMALAECGFSVGPAGTAGLSRFIESLISTLEAEKVSWNRVRRFPDLLFERTDIWLDRQPPAERQVEALLRELRDYLEDEGVYWLSACAVYPELHWELTLFLATTLIQKDQTILSDTDQLELQKRLIDLTRLPWFRQNSMPDWLRRRLISGMTSEQHKEVRQVIRTLLKTARRKKEGKEQKPPGGIELAHAPKPGRDPLGFLKQIVLKRLGRPEQRPVKDYVFSEYMVGGSPGRLAMLVPEGVRKIFYKKGQVVWGARPLAVFTLALFFGCSSWFGLELLHFQPEKPLPIPTFHLVDSGLLLKIRGPKAASDSSLGNLIEAAYFYTGRTEPVQDIYSDTTFYESINKVSEYLNWLKETLRTETQVQLDTAAYKFYYSFLGNSPLYLALNDSLTSTDDLEQIWHSDTLTITEKQQRFTAVFNDRSNPSWKRDYATGRIDTINTIIQTQTTIAPGNPFVTCKDFKGNSPLGINDEFSPGYVWAWARVQAFYKDVVTYGWYKGNRLLESVREIIIYSPPYKTYRLLSGRTFSESEIGTHEVRLYNSANILIGRRVFRVIADVAAKPKPRKSQYDVALQSFSIPGRIAAGQQFKIEFKVNNHGPDASDPFRVMLDLPEGLAEVSPVGKAAVTPYSNAPKSNSFYWDFDSLAANDAAVSLGFTGTFDLSVSGKQVISVYLRGPRDDLNRSNNRIAETVLVFADVETSAKKIASKAPPATAPVPDKTFSGDMVFITGGTFQMGSNDGSDDEKPLHLVTVSSFYISKYEMTVAEFKRFIDATGYQTAADKEGWSYVWTGSSWVKKNGVNWRYDVSGNKRPESELNYPVIHVSWNDASAYCKWAGGRLPTEAEWEYAARGGAKSRGYKYSGSDSLQQVGWFRENSDKKTHPVGQRQPNELGLYDMSGNVWEWCQDKWHDSYEGAPTDGSAWESGNSSTRLLRGGSWYDDAQSCRSAYRYSYGPGYRDNFICFRLVFVP